MDTSFDITFVLPGLIPSGGVRAVLETADGLLDAGYGTAIVVPARSILAPRRTPVGAAQRAAPRSWMPALERVAPRRGATQSWFPLRAPVVSAGPPLWRNIPRSKVVVATSYRTAEELLRLPDIDRTGVYFVQHYEVWSGRKRRVEATWRAFDRIIASSEWLRRLAAERFGKEDVGLAVYGVDPDTFSPSANPARRGKPVIGFMWDDRPWKGGDDVLRALSDLRGRFEFEARAFGLASSGPAGIDFTGRLSGADLAGFYRSLDVFVSPSWSESGPMTVAEAMASGVAVVSTDVGNVRLWSDEGRHCRLVAPRDPVGLADAIGDLLARPEERARLGEGGARAIRPFTWERTARQFESALVSFGLLPLGERAG